MFVQSKTGEIDRRIAQSEKLVDMIAEKDQSVAPSSHSKAHTSTRQSLVVRLRQEVVQLTRDVQRLSRFIGVQRTGFRKLLKKYKKWSESSALSKKFLPILEAPTSFTNQDFTSTFLELSLLYNVLRQAKLTSITSTPHAYPSTENLCNFDCEMVTAVTNSAVFWVHSDNVVETKLNLLRHLSLVSDSTIGEEATTLIDNADTPGEALAQVRKSSISDLNEESERSQQNHRPKNLTYTTFLDNPKKFYSLQTKSEPGQIHSIQGTISASTPVLCSPVGGLRHFCIANLTPEQQRMIRTSEFDVLSDTTQGMDNMSRVALSWVQKRHPLPIAKFCSERTRFRYTKSTASNQSDGAGSSNNTQWDKPDIWATMDSNITYTRAGATDTDWNGTYEDQQDFPYCVLDVRWKSLEKPTWVTDLEQSHLVYPVEGFSVYAHTVAVYYPNFLSTLPKWLDLLNNDMDIRRAPKPKSALSKRNSKSGTNIAAQFSQTPVNPGILLNNERAPLKRNNTFTGKSQISQYGSAEHTHETISDHQQGQPVVRYWNEFDDPEDGADEGIFVVIPEEEMGDMLFNGADVAFLMNLTDRIFDKVSRWGHKLQKVFSPGPKRRSHRNTSSPVIQINGSSSEDDDEDDEESSDYTDYEEGFYSPRFKSSRFGSDEVGYKDYYYNYHNSHAVDQRNNVITAFYTMCFFLSALMVGTLFIAILTEDVSSISQGTFAFILIGFFVAVAIGILAMALFLQRAEMPPWWHQTIVFTVFFSIICFGVGGVVWLYT